MPSASRTMLPSSNQILERVMLDSEKESCTGSGVVGWFSDIGLLLGECLGGNRLLGYERNRRSELRVSHSR